MYAVLQAPPCLDIPMRVILHVTVASTRPGHENTSSIAQCLLHVLDPWEWCMYVPPSGRIPDTQLTVPPCAKLLALQTSYVAIHPTSQPACMKLPLY